MTALAFALVALGSAVGGMARYWCSGLVARRVGETFPWGTLVVNVSGSFLIGVFAAVVAAHGLLPGDASFRELLMVGLCGGYTTFSSFALQTVTLLREGESRRAVLYVVGSALLCWGATALGLVAAGGGG